MAQEYAAAILEILVARDPSKTMCPSEVLSEADKTDKVLMAEVRASAIRLARKGKIQIVQRGEPIDLDHFKGPIRLRRPR